MCVVCAAGDRCWVEPREPARAVPAHDTAAGDWIARLQLAHELAIYEVPLRGVVDAPREPSKRRGGPFCAAPERRPEIWVLHCPERGRSERRHSGCRLSASGETGDE